MSKPQEVVPKKWVEFEENDDELHVRRWIQCSIQAKSHPEQPSGESGGAVRVTT